MSSPTPRKAVLPLPLFLLPALFFLPACAAGPAPEAAAPAVPSAADPGHPTAAQASATTLLPPFTRLSFLGQATLPHGLRVDGTMVGGLSGLAWDGEEGVLWAVSDDSGKRDWRGPSRLYRLALEIAPEEDGEAEPCGPGPWKLHLRVLEAVPLEERDGSRLPPGSADPEGIALTPEGTLLVSSEGDAREGIAPWVREVSRDGRTLRTFPLPAAYRPDGQRTHGVRFNQGFEALTLVPPPVPGAGVVLTATENALAQDGPPADLERGSRSRILVMDAATGEPLAEHVYLSDPVAEPAVPAGELQTAGLVELVALDRHRLLALERSYSAGAGNTIRLYTATLEGATVLPTGATADDVAAARPAAKRLLLEVGALELPLGGVAVDNLEALTWGPHLPDGRRTLLMLSDDNFSAEQTTQLLAFAASEDPVTIPQIQGRGHRSTLEGDLVWEVEGIVTAVQGPGEAGGGVTGYWLQTTPLQATSGTGGPPGDGHPATSEALFVRGGTSMRKGEDGPGGWALEGLEPGDRLAVSGRVVEAGRSGQLTVTTLEEHTAWRRVPERGLPLPEPVPVGPGGLHPPTVVIDDDSLRRFDPATDGADFWESLEGMRILLTRPAVVGPTAFHGGFTVVAETPGAGPRTRRGGVLLRPGDANPERLQVEVRDGVRAAAGGDGDGSPKAPGVDVGDRFAGPLEGVVDYDYANFRLVATAPLPAVEPRPSEPEPSPPLPRGDPHHLTVATWNLWNLDPGDGPERFRGMAERIVGDLGAPDVLALQEIQDASGPTDDGVVDGRPTFRLLVEAIEAAGGPRYDFRQIDPLDGLEGGQPGSNIRVGILFDPRRVSFPDRGRPGPRVPVQVLSAPAGGPQLVPNPGRLAPGDPAFTGAGDYSRSRRPLTAELEFAGRPVYLVDVHFRSKGGDDRLFGPVQPPRHQSEDQRNQQADRVAELVGDILGRDPGAAVIVLGDLNDHEFRSPLRRLEAAGLANLILRVPEEERYTYNYQGNSQVLDHILVSPALAEGAEARIVHGEADRAVVHRLSDHDPVWARVRVAAAGAAPRP